MKDFLSIFFMTLMSLYLCVFFFGSVVTILDIYGILLVVSLVLALFIVSIQSQAVKIEALEARLSALEGEEFQSLEGNVE